MRVTVCAVIESVHRSHTVSHTYTVIQSACLVLLTSLRPSLTHKSVADRSGWQEVTSDLAWWGRLVRHGGCRVTSVERERTDCGRRDCIHVRSTDNQHNPAPIDITHSTAGSWHGHWLRSLRASARRTQGHGTCITMTTTTSMNSSSRRRTGILSRREWFIIVLRTSREIRVVATLPNVNNSVGDNTEL